MKPKVINGSEKERPLRLHASKLATKAEYEMTERTGTIQTLVLPPATGASTAAQHMRAKLIRPSMLFARFLDLEAKLKCGSQFAHSGSSSGS